MKHRETPSLFEEVTGLSLLKAVFVAVPVLALIAASIWVAFHFLDPMPPRRIVLAAGPEGSVLHAVASRYAEIVGRQGIRVEVVATAGSADNLDRLTQAKGTADVGFILAGMATPEQGTRMVNLSNLTYVPLLCVGRAASGEVELAGLKGQRIAVGAPGSGLNAWLTPLLRVNGLTPENTTWLELKPEDSVRALAEGRADIIFLGEGVEAPQVAEALALPGVRLLSLPRAQAYERRFPHIVAMQLPAGILDFARGMPDREIALIGTSVMLAGRADLHPTVVDLFVDAARALHASQGLFEKRGEFPNLNLVDNVPVSPQAVTYVREGPSLLRQYLPLWAADAVQRLLVLAVPLLAVILPLARYLPALLDLMGRRHLLLAYAGLRRIDRRVRTRRPEEPVDDLLRELADIEDSVAGIKESVFKAGDLYTFRVHLRLVREAVLHHAANGGLAAPGGAAVVAE
jgi:TRAP transporter TAXI family solute receptor